MSVVDELAGLTSREDMVDLNRDEIRKVLRLHTERVVAALAHAKRRQQGEQREAMRRGAMPPKRRAHKIKGGRKSNE